MSSDAAVMLDARDLLEPFREMEARGRNVRGILPAVAEILRAAVDDVYDAEGPGWKDLAESTKKGRRGESYKILQDTGVMAQTTGTRTGEDWAEAFAAASYADFHAEGTSKMPKRNPFDLGPFEDGALREIADLLLEEVA